MGWELLLEGVGRRYGLGGSWVLRRVDLSLVPGALVRVEGANGTGKSTLLRLLAGIDAPTEGRITGRPRTAYVPERFPSALPFTALVVTGSPALTAITDLVHGSQSGTSRRRSCRWPRRPQLRPRRPRWPARSPHAAADHPEPWRSAGGAVRSCGFVVAGRAHAAEPHIDTAPRP